ncbi:anthranilate synthase component II [Metaplanococcus flavidus]|uniref:Anthranilate synthase component II n=1 Tax=Metaplanococcus flavidus TaxID=569883 RepID=A0ABW3LDG9_9BACL
MILLIDHFDSFTYNIYQAVAAMGHEVEVVRYGVLTAEEILEKSPKAIILSPGPGHPDAAPESIRLIRLAGNSVPVLGVCLGHQLIGAAFGGTIIHAPVIRHGKASDISHGNKGIFAEMVNPLPAMRYHSLALEADSLPSCLEVQAVAEDDDTIMAIKHNDYPIYGIQFHPESIGTPDGDKLMQGFLDRI